MRALGVLLALGGGVLALSRLRSGSAPPDSEAPRGSAVTMTAGRPYLFIVRLPLGTGPADDSAARRLIEQKGGTNITLSEASVAPFWAEPGQPYSKVVLSFRATPQGNSTIELGMDFYGIGRLEKVVALDGMPFEGPPPEIV